MKWQPSHLTKREPQHLRARWGLSAAGRGLLSSALAKTVQVPIPLTSLSGRKNIEVLGLFIIPPTAQQPPLAMLCYLHLLACVSSKVRAIQSQGPNVTQPEPSPGMFQAPKRHSQVFHH